MRDFYESAYGPVAKEMEAFFETYSRSLDAHFSERDRVVDTTGLAYANQIAAWSGSFQLARSKKQRAI